MTINLHNSLKGMLQSQDFFTEKNINLKKRPMSASSQKSTKNNYLGGQIKPRRHGRNQTQVFNSLDIRSEVGANENNHEDTVNFDKISSYTAPKTKWQKTKFFHNDKCLKHDYITLFFEDPKTDLVK